MSSTATVTIHVVDDATSLPPQWQLVRGQMIDDLTDVVVREDAAANTPVSNLDTVRLVATTGRGSVQYFLANNGPPELNGRVNGNSAFKLRSPNPFNDTSIMPIATTGENLDASTVSSYVLRCRAFVSTRLSSDSGQRVKRSCNGELPR